MHARLDAADLAIHGALGNPQVLALLSAHSYDKKTLQAGQALYQTARELSQEALRKRAVQQGATGRLKRHLASARKHYGRDLQLARVEFEEEPESAGKLGLYGVRERSLSAWIAQVGQFYDTLSRESALAARLKPMGLSPADLEARQAGLKALQAARLNQASARGMAQEQTRKRREAMAELDGWMRRFLKVARVALSEQPQLLEVLGITARA